MPEPSIQGPRPEGHAPTVLQILPRLEAGGVERGALEIAACLGEHGWRSLIVSEGGRLEHRLKRIKTRHIALPVASKNPLTIYRNIARLTDTIKAEKVDIVHVRSRAPAWSAYYAAKRAGCHFVTTWHGTYFGNALKRTYNSIMLRGERVIAISRFIHDHILEQYDVGNDRLRLIPRGVDIAQFDPAQVTQDRIVALAKQWRLPEDRPLVMLPARLTQWKGHDVLVEAMALLPRRDLCCVLVGDAGRHPRVRDRLERLIAARGLEGVVRFVDDCADMPAAYMLADAVVSAAVVPEAFGRTIVEAQAMGRPVIASAHGGASETVIAEETGFLVPPRDAAALARTLERVLGLSPTARQAMAERAMAYVRANYTVDLMCARTFAVYEEVLRAGAPAARMR